MSEGVSIMLGKGIGTRGKESAKGVVRVRIYINA
jgi:hypothetical protein